MVALGKLTREKTMHAKVRDESSMMAVTTETALGSSPPPPCTLALGMSRFLSTLFGAVEWLVFPVLRASWSFFASALRASEATLSAALRSSAAALASLATWAADLVADERAGSAALAALASLARWAADLVADELTTGSFAIKSAAAGIFEGAMPLGMSTDAARASGCAFWSAGLLAPLCARLIASTASMVGAVLTRETQTDP